MNKGLDIKRDNHNRGLTLSRVNEMHQKSFFIDLYLICYLISPLTLMCKCLDNELLFKTLLSLVTIFWGSYYKPFQLVNIFVIFSSGFILLHCISM
jgi:uncharacterized membrane protein